MTLPPRAGGGGGTGSEDLIRSKGRCDFDVGVLGLTEPPKPPHGLL